MRPALLLVLLLIAGCVSVPVPPFGPRIGELGDVKISLQFKYLPKKISSPEQEPTDSMKYAWSQFALSEPKLLKDK